MQVKGTTSEPHSEQSRTRAEAWWERRLYGAALLGSIALWFLAIRAPLWLDETYSWWQIKAGVGAIASRQGSLSFPAYSYILWLDAKVLGSSELALRVPSIVAMLGAVYLVYRIAREIADRDVALTAAVLFSLNPIVHFASIDVRPYAWGALAVAATVYCLVRLRESESLLLAAGFGFLSATVIWFNFLFGILLPCLLIGFFLVTKPAARWRQLAAALVAFAIAFAPVVPGLRLMLRTSGMHNIIATPRFTQMLFTIVPWYVLVGFVVAWIVAALQHNARQDAPQKLPLQLALVLGALPVVLLYLCSVATPFHVFVNRYRLVAVPALALGWALAAGGMRSRKLRLLYCLAAFLAVGIQDLTARTPRQHGYSWKYALQAAEKNAAPDDAPVVICSDYPESDFLAMPVGDNAKDDPSFAPLSYYSLTVPLVPLPRSLNAEAVQDASRFLSSAAHTRFLAMGYIGSQKTLDWLQQQTASTHSVRKLGVFDHVTVLEFNPK